MRAVGFPQWVAPGSLLGETLSWQSQLGSGLYLQPSFWLGLRVWLWEPVCTGSAGGAFREAPAGTQVQAPTPPSLALTLALALAGVGQVTAGGRGPDAG